MQTKLEILQAELTRRQEEVQAYQINIDNFVGSIEVMEAEPDPDLDQFKKDLESRLIVERREQKKVKVIQAAIQKQIEALTV